MKKINLPPEPERRTTVFSIKIRPSVAEALTKAAAKTGRSKASIAEFSIEKWLKENGFLK